MWHQIIAVWFSRVFQKQYVLGGLDILCGYARSMLRRESRYGDGKFKKFLRRCEMRSRLTGGHRALVFYNGAIRERRAAQWNPGENAAGAR